MGKLSEDAAALGWLRGRARGAGAWERLCVAAGAVQTVLIIAQAGLLSWLIHALIMEGRPLAELQTAYWLLPVCIVLRALAGLAKEETGQRASLHIRQNLRANLLDRLYQLGPAWRAAQQSGGLSTVMQEQVEAVDGYFSRYRPQQWLAVVTPLLILLAVLPQSWVGAAILLLTAPMIPFFMVLVGWGAKSRQTRQFQALQRMGGYFLEALRGMPTLRLLDAHRRETAVVGRMADEFRVRTMSVLRLAFLSGTVLEFFASVAVALSAVYLGFTLLGNMNFGFYGEPLTLRTAFFILLLAPEFYQPLRDLGTHYHARAEALAAVDGLKSVLEGESPQPAGGMLAPPESAPTLVLETVDFAYRAEEPVLRGCSLTVAAGETVAVVGPSGGGKTTLLRLVLGQIAPTRGRICVNDVNLDELDFAVWRERVGWMSQHPRLLAGTLADNLRVAKQDAEDETLLMALEFAALDDWLRTLPRGLETPLGEGGQLVSGGQLRRLALARLYLRQADVLLLDEPTASLDVVTEEVIVGRLAQLRRGRTVLLLTHREAPLQLADRVLVLREGALFAAGGRDADA